MTTILLFDTLKFSKRLINAGMSPTQAEEIAEAQKDALEESLNNGLASKKDIARLDKKIDSLSKKFSIHDWTLRFILGLIVAIFGKLYF